MAIKYFGFLYPAFQLSITKQCYLYLSSKTPALSTLTKNIRSRKFLASPPHVEVPHSSHPLTWSSAKDVDNYRYSRPHISYPKYSSKSIHFSKDRDDFFIQIGANKNMNWY